VLNEGNIPVEVPQQPTFGTLGIKGLDAVRIQGQSATVATFRKHILGFGWIKHLLFMALVTFLAAAFSFSFFVC
jgi:hypothetical protein